jgi:hypothetical protein
MKLYCSKNEDHNAPRRIYKTEEFNRLPHETNCRQVDPETGEICDGRFETGMERNARKKAARRSGRLRDQSDAESRAAEEFHEIVAPSGEVCWAKEARSGHVCRGNVEAHHIIEASWWRSAFGDLPEEELLKLVYNPVVGAPLCSGFHADVTPRVGGKRDHIYFAELDRELIEHCERLDLEYPGRGVLARLQHECPLAPVKEGTR